MAVPAGPTFASLGFPVFKLSRILFSVTVSAALDKFSIFTFPSLKALIIKALLLSLLEPVSYIVSKIFLFLLLMIILLLIISLILL